MLINWTELMFLDEKTGTLFSLLRELKVGNMFRVRNKIYKVIEKTGDFEYKVEEI
ncbi:MAG: hypothetical protein ACTSRS_22230 [Candidatus Helarchaeota archaeon]